MSGTRLDCAMIQPLVLALEPWIALRRRMHEVLREDATDLVPVENATILSPFTRVMDTQVHT